MNYSSAIFFFQRYSFIFFVSMLFLSKASSEISADLHSKANKKKILIILGDSLTEGLGVSKDSAFPALIEQKMMTSKIPWRVVNAGVSGSTTASAVPRLKWLLRSNPNLILILLGSNDGLRGLSVKETKKNLQEAILLIQKQKVPVLLGDLSVPPNYGAAYSDEFKKIYKDLAKEFKIPLIPFILQNVAGQSKLNQVDGIHPNEEGHKIIADTLFKNIKEYLQ